MSSRQRPDALHRRPCLSVQQCFWRTSIIDTAASGEREGDADSQIRASSLPMVYEYLHTTNGICMLSTIGSPWRHSQKSAKGWPSN